jgi:hypothetical protein
MWRIHQLLLPNLATNTNRDSFYAAADIDEDVLSDSTVDLRQVVTFVLDQIAQVTGSASFAVVDLRDTPFAGEIGRSLH